MASKKLEFIDSKYFRRKNAAKLFGTPLPTMPAAPAGEPWEYKRATQSYVMSREEEKQRFLEWNYAKKNLNTYNSARNRGRARHLEEYLVRLNLPLVYMLLCRFRWKFSNLEWDDGVSVGQGALMRAMLRFNPDLGWKFSSYACRAILNCFRQSNAKTTRRKIRLGGGSEPIEAYSDQLLVDEDTTPDIVEQLRAVLGDNRAALDDNEILVISHRFELGGCTEKETLEQIGDRLGVSKERIRQIQNKALAKLRDVLAK